MSYLELLRALSNGVSAKGMVLAICRSFSFAYPLFASLKMSGLSVTSSGYWHPPTPDTIPLQSQTQNLHSVPTHPKRSYHPGTPKKFNVTSAKEYGVIFYKKYDEKKRRKKKFHTPFQKSCKMRSWNKKTKFDPSVSPFLPLPLTFYHP